MCKFRFESNCVMCNDMVAVGNAVTFFVMINLKAESGSSPIALYLSLLFMRSIIIKRLKRKDIYQLPVRHVMLAGLTLALLYKFFASCIELNK